MNLPKRKYYNINDAANLLSCSVNDIIHFGATERLDIYAYINHKNSTDDFHFQINLPNYALDKIDCFAGLFFEDWSATDVQFKERNASLPVSGFYAKQVKGLFFIDPYVLTDLEFSDVNRLNNEFPVEFNVLDFEIIVNADALCIKSGDLEKLKDLCHTQNIESDKTLAKKENLIKSLLTLIPELSGVDIDTFPVKKLKEIIEATAANRGVDFPKTDLGTWSKYLERGRHKK